MALFYLVRHGEADYSAMLEKGFWGFGRSFAPLSERGKQQAEITAKDIRLKNAEFIVSSPYTRALQTAQILSRETGLRVEVDIDLHEWEPDESNQYRTSEESFAFAREFNRCGGEYPPGEKCRWETLSHMRKRMMHVADKYADHDKVIFVGHGMAFRCLTYIEKNGPCRDNRMQLSARTGGVCVFLHLKVYVQFLIFWRDGWQPYSEKENRIKTEKTGIAAFLGGCAGFVFTKRSAVFCCLVVEPPAFSADAIRMRGRMLQTDEKKRQA